MGNKPDAPQPAAKPAPKPAPKPVPQVVSRTPVTVVETPSPVKLIHYNPGAVFAGSQREAYELDAADGVIDGKHFGSNIHIYPSAPPTAESYYNRATNLNPSVRRPHNDWQASADQERNRGGHSGHETAASAYARSAPADYDNRHFTPAVHDDGHPSPRGHVHPPLQGGKVIGVEYRELSGLGAFSTPMESFPVTSRVVGPVGVQSSPAHGLPVEPSGASYEYTASSYINPTSKLGYIAPTSALPPLPPAASKPNIPVKSYYDTYSRFAKVEFHTISKSPYAHLLANQGRTVNIGQIIPQREPEELDEQPEEEPPYIEEPVRQVETSWPRAAPAPHEPKPEPPFTIEDPVKPSAYIADYDSPAAPQVNVSPPSPPPAPPAWDSNDPATLGGFDADTSARMAFRRYDTDGNGFLDIYEFMAAMKALGSGTTFKEAQDLFSQIDVDGGGAIEEEEFVQWYIQHFAEIRETNDPKKLAQTIFRKYDTDGNGCLDVEEFVGAMRELGLGYSLEDAQFVFDTFDNDGGGTIDEDEFVAQYYEQWLQQQ